MIITQVCWFYCTLGSAQRIQIDSLSKIFCQLKLIWVGIPNFTSFIFTSHKLGFYEIKLLVHHPRSMSITAPKAKLTNQETIHIVPLSN